MNKKKLFREIICKKWIDYSEIVNNKTHRYFAYRGQGSKKWKLQCSIQRAFNALQVPEHYHLPKEKETISMFQSRAHLFLKHLPSKDNPLEWLSIMQHYGAPTRLLDFTYSPYIAMYFAFEEFAESNYEPCIYAFDIKELHKLNIKLFGTSYQNFLFSGKPLVFFYEPVYQHERLAHQQGLFAVFGNIEFSLNELFHSYDEHSITIDKFIFTNEFIKKGIENLNLMNISKETLFPGIEGLCQSLKLQLSFPPVELT